jgi:hypothetical protein
MRRDSVNILASVSASFYKLSDPSVSKKNTKQLRLGLNMGSDHIQIPCVQLLTVESTLNYILSKLLLFLQDPAFYLVDSFFQYAFFLQDLQSQLKSRMKL